MAASALNNAPTHPSPTYFRAVWDALTKPATALKNADKPRARLLSAMLAVFIPLAAVAVFINPLTELLAGKSPVLPAAGVMIGYFIIPVAYVFSRTRFYTFGAWLTIITPVIAVGLPILMTGVLTSVIPLFYLTLSVIMAALLLSSRDTLIVGITLAVLTILMPKSQAPDLTAAQNQNWSAFAFILITTGITVLVGRIRENNLRQLEQSQLDLSKSLSATEEARVQAEQSRERAERADHVKSAFLASMSHELRTPLNSIINFTEFVADGDTGPINEEQKGLLLEVVGSGKHLLNLINDVLDMSKIEAGSLRLFIEDDVDLKSILDSGISTCQSLVKDTVQMQTSIEDNLPLVSGDRQRILQILLNIISNACKFTQHGEIKISAYQAQGEIVVSVADTGPGIALEDQSNVFEPFKQTTTGLRQGGGTGLGMPIAKSLAEAHGGRLWLRSEVNKGATFYFALPVKSEQPVPVL